MAEEQKLGTLWFGAEVRLDELKKQIKEGNQDILNALTLSIDDKTAKQMIQNLQNALNSHPVDVKLNVNGKSITDSIGQLEKALSAGSISELGVFENRVNSIRQKIKELQEQMDALPRNKSGKLLLAGDEERLKTMTAQMKELQSQEAVAVANLTGAQKRYSDALEVTRVNAENVARAVQQINQAEQKGGTQQGGVLDTQKFKTLQDAIDKIIGEINRLQQAFTHLGENSSLSNLSTMINGLAITLSSLSNAIKIQPLDEQVKALLDRCEKAEAKLREVGDAARYLNERAGANTQQKAANIAEIAGINDKATVSLEKYSKLLYDVENALYRLNNISAAGGSKLLNQPIEQLEQMRKMLNEFGVKGENGRIIDTLLSESDYAKIRESFNAIKTGYKDVASESDRYTKSKQNGAAATSHLSEEERKLASAIKSSTDSMRGQSQVLSDLKTMATQYLSIWGAQSFVNSIIQTGGLLEQQRMSIGAILGDLSQANHLFGQITQLALKSPFGVVQLDTMSKQLTAYNFKYSELYDWTKRLADISAATGTEVSRLALALGHVRSEGALSGYTLRQFAMGNVPLLQTLAQQLGKTTAEIRKMTREKAITYEDVEQALRTLTEEGGIFFNAQEVMSNALNAKFKNLHDAFDIMFGKMAESGVGDVLKKVAETLTVMAKNWETVGATILTVAGAVGVYRAGQLIANKTMVESNALMGRYTAKQLEMQARTGALTKETLLQAVAMKKYTVAEALAAAKTYDLTAAQLKAVATSGRVNAAYTTATISTSKYTMAQLRLMASFKYASWASFTKYITGMQLALGGLANAARVAGVALKGIFLNPATWWMVAITAGIEAWMHFSEKADEAKERVKDLMQTANEGFKSLEKESENFKIGSSLGLDKKQLQEVIGQMEETLKSYSPQAGNILSEAFKIDESTGKSVHSLQERYEMLAKAIQETKESYAELGKISGILEQSNDDTDGGFDESFRKNTEDYIDALKYWNKAENDFVANNRTNIVNALAKTKEAFEDYNAYIEKATSAFKASEGKEGFSEDNLKAQLDAFVKFGEAGNYFAREIHRYGGEAYEQMKNWENASNDVSVAFKRMDGDMETFTTKTRERLEAAFGATVENWTNSQKLAVQKSIEIFMTGINGYSDMAEKERMEMEEKLLAPFGIKIDIDARDANKQLTDMQLYLNNLVGKDWVVKLKLETVGSFEDLYDQLDKTVKKSGETIKKLGDGISDERKRLASTPMLSPEVLDTLTDKEKEYREAVLNRSKAIQTANQEGFKLSSLEKENQKANRAANKAESAAEKAAKEKTKQAEARLKIEEELAKQRLELQDAIADAEVAAIENNAERERAQRKVEFEKQKRQLDRQVEEWKRKSFELAKKEHEANPKNKTINFYDTPVGKAGWQAQKLTPEQEGIRNAKAKTIEAEEKRRIKEDNEALIASHADYIDKKIALDKKYNETFDKLLAARDKAEKEGDKKTVEALTRTMVKVSYDKAKEQAQLSLEQLKEMPDYVRAFEDLDNTSTETLEFLIKEFEKVKGAAAKNLDPKDLKEFTDALQRMQDKVSERNPFKGFIDSTKELKAANKEVEAAKKQLELVKAGGLVYSDKTEVIDGKVFQKVMDVAEAEEIYRKALDKRRKATRKSNKELGEALDKVDELNNAIKNLGDSIGGEAGEIISLIGDIGTFATSVINAVNFTAKGTSAAIRAVEKASVILAIASAALQIIQKITSLFGADYEQYDAMKAQYENLIDVWDQLIDKKKEYINIKYGSEAIQASKEAIELLNKETEAWRELGKERLNSGASMGSHSIGVRSRDNMNYSDWLQVAKSLGRSTDNWAGLGGRLTGLFDLTTEQLAKLKQDAPAFWSKLDEDVREYLDHIIEGAETLKEIEESVQTKIIGKSKTEFIDDFMDSLYDLANGADDVFDDVEESWRKMLNKMVIDNLIAKKLSEELEAIYKKIYDLQERKNSANDYNAEEYRKQREAIEAELEALKSEESFIDWIMHNPSKAFGGYDAYLESISGEVENLEKKLEALRQAEALAQQGMTDEEYEAELRKIYEELDGVWASYEDMIEDFQKRGLLNNVVGETIFGIDAIKDAFKSLVTDTELDMEKWGKNLKNSMIESLIEAMVFGDEFKEWLKGLKESFNEAWKSYKETGDRDALNAFLTSVTTDIDNMGDDIAEKIKELKEALGYSLEGEEGDNPFSGLRDSFLDTLTNMEDDAEAFKKRLTEIMVKDMIDKNVLGTAFKMDEYFDLDSGEKIEKVFENFDKYLEDWNERYKKAVESGNQDLIDALIDELVRAREITIEAAEQWRDKIKEVTKDTTFSDMSDSWVSTLMDMSKTAEDWAENVGKIMAEQIIKQMIVPTYIQPLLDELQDVFNKVMEDATSTDENGKKSYDWESVINNEDLQAQLDIMSKKFPELQAIIKQIMEALHLDTSNYKYSGFSNLGDSILESLKSSEGSLENWAKSIGQQMAEDMAKAYIDATYGKDIDDLNKAWQKALQGCDTAAMKDIEDQLSALYGKMADDQELQRLIDKFRELAENPFKDMASDFASSLMDMEQSAEDFANNIAKSLTQEMITKVIKDQYQGKIDALGEQWKQALEAGDSAAIERIRQQLEALYEKMGESVKPLLDAIKDIGKETDTTFTSMKDSWVSALMDMEGTAEDFAQTVGRTMAQKIITEMIAPTYIQPILDAMQKAYNLAIAAPGATISSVLAQMTPFIGQIEDVYRQIQPMIEGIFGTIGIVADSVEEAAEEVEYALGDMKSNFVSALMDMTNSAEDFSKDISKIMAQTFIEKFVLGEQFDRQMEYWQQQYESIIGSGMSEDERKRQLKALRDTIVAAKEGYVNEAMAIQELFGLTTEDSQTATMNMADKITYDQADQLLGINLAQELTLEQILATLQGKDIVSVGGSGMTWQSASGAQNDEQSRLINATLTNFAQMTQQNHDNILTQVAMANSHLQMIRDYSKKICDQVELHMESMDDKLSYLRNW